MLEHPAGKRADPSGGWPKRSGVLPSQLATYGVNTRACHSSTPRPRDRCLLRAAGYCRRARRTCFGMPGCIAMVYRDRDRAWQTQIQWQQSTLRSRCASREQGMRWIERWMEKRAGLPGSGCRRVIRRPAWLAAFSRECGRI